MDADATASKKEEIVNERKSELYNKTVEKWKEDTEIKSKRKSRRKACQRDRWFLYDSIEKDGDARLFLCIMVFFVLTFSSRQI